MAYEILNTEGEGEGQTATESAPPIGERPGGCSDDPLEDVLERDYIAAIEQLMSRVANANSDSPPAPSTEDAGMDAQRREQRKLRQPRDAAPESEPRPILDEVRAPETRDQLTVLREVANKAAQTSINKYRSAQRRSAVLSLFLGVAGILILAFCFDYLTHLAPLAGFACLAILGLLGIIVVNSVAVVCRLSLRCRADRRCRSPARQPAQDRDPNERRVPE